MSEPITDPSWIDQIVPPHGTVTGQFVAVSYDSADADLSPDVQPFTGRVILTPTTPMGRLDDALAHIRPVTVRIFGGQIVDEEDMPGVRILATDAEIGVEDWAWTASIELDDGPKLKPITFKLPADETVNLTSGIVPVESAPYQIVKGEKGDPPTQDEIADAADPFVVSRVGSRTIALDTDGTPYWAPSGGSAYLLYDLDGHPYWQATLPPAAQEDADGTPYLVSPPVLPEAAGVAWGEVVGKPATYPPSSHTHSEYVTTEDVEAAVAALPVPDVMAAPSATPAWSGGASARSWDPSLHLYNGESPDLDAMRGIVRNGGHIVYIGDSKTQGQGSTSWHTEEDAPSGVFQRLTGARPGVMFLIPDAQREQWRGTVGFAASPGLYGMPKEGATSSTVHLKPGPAHTAITWWARGVDGAATVTPTIDGVATAPVTIPQGGEWTATRIEHPDESVHTYQWATTDRIDFLGVAFEYASPGLTITNAGRAASRMDHGGYGWRQSTDPGSLWHQALGMVPVDGVIVQLGTNRAVNPLTDGYGEIAALGHPWAITVPGCTPDDTDRLARIAESYTLAGTHDVPLIDHRHLLGNEAQAASRDLAQIGSLVHENSRGYRLEGVLHHRILNP